jgi:eukaryotic-like serine/threonine-protein kinase
VVGETVANRFEVEELVGAGGMSSVYRARDALLERHVALKVLHQQYGDDEEFVERFRREARSVAQLSHPNIVTVIDRGEDRGRQFIVFEYIDGENLKQLVVRRGRLAVREALELAIQVARGLAFAHESGIVHRDVKPQNVLLNGDGQAKVTDFGIARTMNVDGVTQAGTILGTSNYIAPEQASGQEVDAHTDVYSLGVVLYELLAGDVPFPGENFVSVALKHVNDPPPNLLEVRRDVPPRVAAAVDRALEKDPRRRFPTMDSFAAELAACLAALDGHSVEPGTVVLPPRPGADRRRRQSMSPWPVALAAVGLAAIAAVIVGFFALRGHHRPSPVAVGTRISLHGVGAYDPYGDHHEHDADAPKATDRSLATYWSTEHYDSFTKPGVGLVLDAGRAVTPHGITIDTGTPGFTAEIRAGSSPSGPFRTVSNLETIDGETTIPIHAASAERYFVVWITKLPVGTSSVQINEVRAS